MSAVCWVLVGALCWSVGMVVGTWLWTEEHEFFWSVCRWAEKWR